jgi:S-adenosylmethionine hydrolase
LSARARRLPCLTLTTDFGYQDAYVAAMKGVILRAAPEARIVDISHGIAPQAITEAGYVLACAFPHFPAGTVHLVVVDPGVGTSRRLLAARTKNHVFLAPDNGCLGLVFAVESPLEVVQLPAPDAGARVAPTFHGRDLLAPAAARLLLGAPLAEIGIPAADPHPFPVPFPRREPDGRWRVTVLSVDRFGSLILNFRDSDHPGGKTAPALELAGRRLAFFVRTYGEAPEAEPVLLFNSSGFLEVAVPNGSAAQALGCARGEQGWLTL